MSPEKRKRKNHVAWMFSMRGTLLNLDSSGGKLSKLKLCIIRSYIKYPLSKLKPDWVQMSLHQHTSYYTDNVGNIYTLFPHRSCFIEQKWDLRDKPANIRCFQLNCVYCHNTVVPTGGIDVYTDSYIGHWHPSVKLNFLTQFAEKCAFI